MLDDVLIESAGKDKQKAVLVTMLVLISAVIHLGIIAALIVLGMLAKEGPAAIEKPIAAFIAVSAPPPPPPPPPAGGGSRPKATPKVETPQERPRQEFRQPTETPQVVPEAAEVPQDEDSGAAEGGQVGGVKGGQVGGVVGGQIGGVVGGQIGGVVGGQVGGTGDVPVRVGGNVKAPIRITDITPIYTEAARRARIQGFVVIEAVVDRNGNVTEARVLKPLPLGLDQAALEAVKRLRFKPATLNGQPVPVYYNLTVNFQLNN
jgi:periplasmic protein TonB